MQPRNLSGGTGTLYAPSEPTHGLIQIGMEHMPRLGATHWARVTNGKFALKSTSEGKYDVGTCMTPFVWSPSPTVIMGVREQFAHWVTAVREKIFNMTKDVSPRSDPVVPITNTGLELTPRPVSPFATGDMLSDQKLVEYNDFRHHNWIIEESLLTELVNKLQASVFNTLYLAAHTPAPLPIGIGTYKVRFDPEAGTLPIALDRRPGLRVELHNSDHEFVWDFKQNTSERMQAKTQLIYQVWLAVALDYLFDFPICVLSPDAFGPKEAQSAGLCLYPDLKDMRTEGWQTKLVCRVAPSRSKFGEMTFADVMAISEEFKAQWTGYGDAKISDDITAYDVIERVIDKIGVKHSVVDRDAYADPTRRLIFEMVFGLVSARLPTRVMDMTLIRKRGQFFTTMMHLEHHVNSPYMGGSLTNIYRPMTRMPTGSTPGNWTALPMIAIDNVTEAWSQWSPDPVVPTLVKVDNAELPSTAITTDRANPKLTSLAFHFPSDARRLIIQSQQHTYYNFKAPTWHYRHASSAVSPLSKYQLLMSYFSGAPGCFAQAYEIPYDPEGRLSYVKAGTTQYLNIIEKDRETLTDITPLSDGTAANVQSLVQGPVEAKQIAPPQPTAVQKNIVVDDAIKVA